MTTLAQHHRQQEQAHIAQQAALPTLSQYTPQSLIAPQSPTQSQRLKCGEVYTWDCAGELYGVECALCEEHPLCTLAEFSEHMDIWHCSWTQEAPAPQTPTSLSAEPQPVQLPLTRMQISPASSAVLAAGESVSMVPPTAQCGFGDIHINGDVATDCAANKAQILTINVANQPEPFAQVLIAADDVAARSTNSVHGNISANQDWDESAQNELLSHVNSIIGMKDANVGTLFGTNNAAAFETAPKVYDKCLANKLEQSIASHRQNLKLIEVYEQFPILWHSSHRHSGTPEKCMDAFRSISDALKLCGINLSAAAIQRRLNCLRKRYRLEKFQDLSSQLQGQPFIASFKYYALMQFLDEHMEPHVCEHCNKIHKGDDCPCQREQVAKGAGVHQNQSIRNINSYEMIEACDSKPVKEGYFMADNPAADAAINGTQLNEEHEMWNTFTAATHPCADTASKNELSPYANNELATMTEHNSSDVYNVPQLEISMPSFDEENSFMSDMEDNDITQEQTFARLTTEQTRELISLYGQYPLLWDPGHVDFNSRKLRRTAWRMITSRFNKTYGMNYAWKTVHRKLCDYVKYYKREKQRIESELTCTKWCFYDDFAFMEAALTYPVDAQQKTLTKQQNLQIIAAYRAQPQLWDTNHPEFRRRTERHAQIVAMCAQLKSDNGICITTEKLKLRFIEYRCSYRAEKARRLATTDCPEAHSPKYEYYEALHFLDPHVSPFICDQCSAKFKRHTDFVQHMRKQHPQKNAKKRRRRRHDAAVLAFMNIDAECVDKPQDAAVSSTSNNDAQHDDGNPELNNVCHICGISFTLYHNLVYHLKRHMNRRTHACTMCPKKFFNSTALRVHERAHTKSRPFICEYCGAGYVNGSKLNQHMKRHRNQRDHACDQCGKTFYTAFDRDRHVRGHQKLPEKICQICGRTFSVGSSYYAHMLLHSDVKRYSCKVCGHEFAQYAGLYKHRKRYHPDE